MKLNKIFNVVVFNLCLVLTLPVDAIKLTADDIAKIRANEPTSSVILRQITEAKEVYIELDAEPVPFAMFLLMDKYWNNESINCEFRNKLQDFFIRKRAPFFFISGELVNASGQTLLMLAAKNSHLELLFKHLLKNAGYLLEQTDKEGNNVMHYAVQAGLLNNIFAIIELDAGHVLVNQVNALGQTPLMLAILFNKPRAVAMLLEHGAVDTVLHEDIEGQTAFDLAEETGNQQIIALLAPLAEVCLSDDDMLEDGDTFPEGARPIAIPRVLPPPLLFTPRTPPTPDIVRPIPQHSPPRRPVNPRLNSASKLFGCAELFS